MAAQMPLPLPPASGASFGVTSFNILSANAGGPSWPSRAPKVVSEINQTGASIVATQENSNVSAGVGNGKSPVPGPGQQAQSQRLGPGR